MGRLRILQINLRKSGPALNLARQTVTELLTDVILVSEQPRVPPDSPARASSTDGRAAITIPTGSDAVMMDSGGLGTWSGPGSRVSSYSASTRIGN